MGLGALANNIISDRFPDDDEEFFDANFFYLNEDTDPDIDLNFQYRQD